VHKFVLCSFHKFWQIDRGYWRQTADERLGDPPPQRWIQEPLVTFDQRGWSPQVDPLVYCFCVCSGSALLGDLLGVSRSRERDLLSVLPIYPKIFLHVFIAYRLLVSCLFVWICSYMLVVLVILSVLSKWLAIERPSDDTFMRWGDYLHKAQVD